MTAMQRRMACAIATLLVCSVMSFAATHKLTRIGINTFAQVRGDIPTAEVMKTIADKYAGDIKYGLDQVGMGTTYLTFLEQLRAAKFTEKSIPMGDTFYWMFFRLKGKVTIWEDVQWAGPKPLEVFSFPVSIDGKNYEFVIPKPCGNIALYKAWDNQGRPIAVPGIAPAAGKPAGVQAGQPAVVPGGPPAKPGAAQAVQPGAVQAGKPGAAQAVQPGAVQAGKPGAAQAVQPGAAQAGKPGAIPAGKPGAAAGIVPAKPEAAVTPAAAAPLAVCDLRVSPEKANRNDPITVDMSGSKNAAGLDVDLFTAQGTKITSHTMAPGAAKWQTRLDKPGTYVLRGRATNADGKVSENPCESRVIINAPPVCKLWTSCLPCEDYVGKAIVFDANGSTDDDGQVVKASFQLTDASGAVVDSFVKTAKPFLWEKVITKPGAYVINVVVFDDMGAPSTNVDPCRVTFGVTQKRFFFLAEAGGLLAKGTYTSYLFGRLGMMWSLFPDAMDVIIRLGGALPLHGDPWKSFFMADALANFHLGPAIYIDLGLGYTGKEQDVRKSGVDAIGAIGLNLFNNYSSAGSVFGEVRIPVITSGRSFDEHHKILLGFRYIF
jgi:hypothetical protein